MRLLAARREADLSGARVAPFNAEGYLTIPSPSVSDEVVHPDVIDTGGLHGYRYWMAVTRYPGGDNALEDPCVFASNDRTTWEAPGSNPVDTFDGNYNSDTDMILVGSTLHLFYRRVGVGEAIVHRSSTDGETWSARTTLFTDSNAGNTAWLSPAVVYDGSQFVMYAVSGTQPDLNIRYRTCATPNGTWSASAAAGYTRPTYGASGVHYPWHVDAIRWNDRTYLLINESAQTGRNLRWAVSDDGINFTAAADPFLTTPSGTWDGTSVYRATAVPRDGDDLFYVWYSAAGPAGWQVGLTEVPADLLP